MSPLTHMLTACLFMIRRSGWAQVSRHWRPRSAFFLLSRSSEPRRGSGRTQPHFGSPDIGGKPWCGCTKTDSVLRRFGQLHTDVQHPAGRRSKWRSLRLIPASQRGGQKQLNVFWKRKTPSYLGQRRVSAPAPGLTSLILSSSELPVHGVEGLAG